MKIIAFLFLVLIGFFTMEPLMNIRGIFGQVDSMASTTSPEPKDMAAGMHCCGKMRSCPKKDSPAGNNEKCQGNGCNPFMACAYGNFYLAEKGGVDFISIALQKDKKILINDNRLSSRLSECWHPPELTSDLIS